MDSIRRKFPQLKLFVIICYLSVFTSPGVRPVSLAQASTQGYIKKEINSSAKSIPKPVRLKDLIAIPTKELPVAHEATISGVVLDDLGNPLVGTTVVGVNPLKPEETFQTTTNAQGQYNLSVVFKGKAEETIQDFQVDIFKEGYTPKQEEAEVVATRVEGLGTSILKILDTKITAIGSSGGTHVSSKGDVKVVVPAGALSATKEFRTTLFEKSKELPGALPPTSFFTYAGTLEADESDIEFGAPVKVQIANTLGFAPGTEIPIGYYNEETRAWEDSGQMAAIDSTGEWVEYQTTHFSTPDVNLPALPPPEAQGPTGSTEGQVENHSASTNISRDDIASNCNASKIDMHTGNLYQEHFLPSIHAMNQDITLEFAYKSTTAKPFVLLATQTDLDSRYSLQPETQTATFEIEGISESATFKNTFGKNAARFMWDGKNALDELVSTGSYPYKITLSNDYPGTYYTADCFGCDPIEDTGIPTRETIPETTSVTGRVIVNNQQNSSFGSGWNLANSKRLYSDPDGRVLLVEGDGSSVVFGQPHEDIVTANGSDDDSVLLGKGDGSFQFQTSFEVGDWPFFVAVGNFNGDSYQDVVTANYSSEDVSILLGNGDGTFKTERRFGVGDAPFSVAVGDFNEDSYQDLVTANYYDDTVSVLLGNGDGSFQPPVPFSVGYHPYSVAIGDFNKDNHQDLVTTNYYDDTVSVLLGKGDGSFQSQTSFGVGNFPFSVVVGNFNEDGYQDLVTANYDDTVSVLLGNGDGNFQIEKRFGAGDFPMSVAVGDFNVDSYQDLVTANYYDDTVSVLLGNGDGSFQSQRIFGVGYWPESVAVGDFNEDGYQDMVTANAASRDVSVLLGNGDGNFQTEKRFGAGGEPVSVAVGHFNANPEAGEYEAFGDPSKLKKNSDDTFKLTEKDGIVYQFNAKGLLTSETDRNGNTISYTYDTDDSLQTIIYPGNGTFTFAYDSSTKKLESVTDSAGRKTQFVVDSNGNLTQIVNPDGTSKSYTYDSEHLMTTKTEENGNTTDYLYDDKYGRINETRTPPYDVWNGSSTTRERVSTFYFPSDVKGLINDFTEGVGTPDNPAPIVDPTTLTDEITGACGCSSKKGYTNAFGSWTESQDGLGRKTKYTRDSENNVSRIEYPNGRIVDMTYDGKGNLLTAKESYNSATTTFTYDSIFNQVTSIKNPLNYTTTINYDAKGNPVQIVDANATTTEMTYDSRGLLTSLKQAKGIADLENTTTFEYDATTSNLVKTIDSLTNETVLTYDSAGNLKTILDAEGKTTTTNYDSQNNNLTSVEDHLGNLTEYQYDNLGNLTHTIDAKGNTTEFTYNELHLLSSILNPLDNLKTFTYDSERRLGRIVDAKNQTIKFEYDAAHQLTKKYLPEETVTYAYDTGGNLTSLQDSDSKLSFTYDKLNLLTKAQTLSGGVQPTTSISYTYDKNNNRATMTDVQSKKFNYYYDNLNRLTDIKDYTTPTTIYANYVYDVLSRRTALKYFNNTQTTYAYDLASQLTNLTNLVNPSSPTIFSKFDYTYNDVGYRDTMTTLSGAHNYTYDDLYRLEIADHPDSSDESYSYDEVGNRLDNYTTNAANQLTDDGTYTYEYDNNGNMTKRTKKLDSSVTTYTYNSENQLTQITSGSNTYKYAYDGLERRIQKDVSGTLTKYVYDNEDIVAEYSGTSTTPAATYLHGPGIDEPIYMSRGGQIYYYHADGLGSITELTGSTGAVAQSYKYDAFGNILS